MLVMLNKSSFFLILVSSLSWDNFNTIDLKVFHVFSTITAGISLGLLLSKSCRWSLTLDLERKLPDWHFAFPYFMPHLWFSCGIDRNMVSTAIVSSHHWCSVSLTEYVVGWWCSWWGASVWIFGASTSSCGYPSVWSWCWYWPGDVLYRWIATDYHRK